MRSDRRIDRVHNEASSRLSQFLWTPQKTCYSVISDTCLSLVVSVVFMVMTLRGRAGRTNFAKENIAYTSNLSNADGMFLWKIFTHVPGCIVL